ncbi:MAG TPA: hypothetical protein VJR89_19125, partial [Polyangiales bacterium]|nr:hypothetical protein [Polyangiales bacterium]
MPSSKAKYEIAKKEPEPVQGGYFAKEKAAKDADKQNLPKNKDGKPIKKKGFEISTGPALKLKTASDKVYGKYGNKENDLDKSYWGMFRQKTSDVEALELAVNTAEGKAKLTMVKAEGEVQFWHGQFDLGDLLN